MLTHLYYVKVLNHDLSVVGHSLKYPDIKKLDPRNSFDAFQSNRRKLSETGNNCFYSRL